MKFDPVRHFSALIYYYYIVVSILWQIIIQYILPVLNIVQPRREKSHGIGRGAWKNKYLLLLLLKSDYSKVSSEDLKGILQKYSRV